MDKSNSDILGKMPLTATGQRGRHRWAVEISGHRHGAMNRWPLMLCLWVSMLSCHVIANELEVPGQHHSRKPLIGQRYINDQDGNALEDQLEARLNKAEEALAKAVTKKEKNDAQKRLDTFVEVELIFKSPLQQSRLAHFKGLGGHVDYIYKAVSYGWNGKIPLGRLRALTAGLGSELVLVQESQPIQAHLDVATANGRVRPVWNPGFAGSLSGFKGSNSITIAIVDSGVDPNHPDLQERCVYWKDYSYDNSAVPIDKYHHGSHVAGIATGTGLSRGSETGTFYYTDVSHTFLTFAENGFFEPNPITLGVSDTPVVFTSTSQWFGEAPTSLSLLSKPKGINTPSYITNEEWMVLSDPNTGYSPLSESNTFTPSSDLVYTTALPANLIDYQHLVGRFVTTNTIDNVPGTTDGFNQLSGVAPACNWAGSKVFTKNGVGQTLWLGPAIDDLVDNRVDKNIKVMNLSLGLIGSPGLSPSLRQKINTAVSNGIVVVISAGNDGRNSIDLDRVVDDPGRAAYAITVAASNDENQVTDYSSQGFPDPNNTAGQEEDYKPDITAPGGSIYDSYIMSVDSGSGDGGSYSDQQPNDYTSFRGTSMASPYIAGCAALVIDALEQQGRVWDFNSIDDPMFIKMILLATASETNAARENGIYNPSLQRALAGPDGFPVGKDPNEGYGLVNADAAIEAITQDYVLDTMVTDTLGPGLSDKRVWARWVEIPAETEFEPYLIVPDGADFDIYLFDAQPGLYGQPVLLASSTKEPKPSEDPGIGLNEDQLSYSSGAASSGLLVVKRVWGSGQFSLTTLTPSHQVTAVSEPNGVIDPNGVFIKKFGSDINFKAIPDPGYYVDSWFVDGNEVNTSESEGKSFTLTDITTDHTVTVSFRLLVYECTITAEAGANGTIDPSGTFTLIRESESDILSQEFNAIPDPNYQVDCWSVDGVVVQYGDTTFSLLDINDDHTVTVSFKPLTYTLTATAGPNGTIEPSGMITVTHGSGKLFLATPNPGYQVETWFVDGIEAQSGGSTYLLSDITASHDVAVSFEPRLTYDIIAITGPNGSVDPNGLVIVPTDSNQLFVATPDPGYQVDCWTVDEVEVQTGGKTFTLSYITASHTVFVAFKQRVTCDILTSAGPNGAVDPNGLITVPYRSDQLFTATPDPGYKVDVWFVDGIETQFGRTNFFLSDIQDDHVVEVSFTLLTYTVNASAGPNGTIDPVGLITKPYGSDQLFAASPDPDYAVDTWVVDGNEVQTGGTDYTLSHITVSHTVAVSFTPTYTITASAGANGTIDPNGLVIVPADSNQLFVATPDLGYQVDCWTVDEVEVQFGGTNFLLTGVQDEHLVMVSFKPLPLSISGTVNSLLEVPVEGVSVTADNGGGMDITDPNGFYEVRVDYNWSGTLIPEKAEFVVDPNVIEFDNVLDSIENQDYTARSIYDLDASGWIDLGDLEVFSGYWLLSDPGLPCDFHQDGDNIINLLDFAVFSGRWRWE